MQTDLHILKRLAVWLCEMNILKSLGERRGYIRGYCTIWLSIVKRFFCWLERWPLTFMVEITLMTARTISEGERYK